MSLIRDCISISAPRSLTWPISRLSATASTPCPSGQNGSKTITKVGSIYGDTILTLSSCCDTPLFDKLGGTSPTPECGCDLALMKNLTPDPFEIDGKAYIYDDKPQTGCKADVKPGEFAKGGVAYLCGTDFNTQDGKNIKGYYCPQDNMGESKLCTKGHYCPQRKDQVIVAAQSTYGTGNGNDNNNPKNDDLFTSKKKDKTGLIYQGENVDDSTMSGIIEFAKTLFTDKSKLENTGATASESTFGGLIDEIPCPAGYKCPDDGMAQPVKCEAGTYSTGGATSCTPCPLGQTSEEGASECHACKAGTYGIIEVKNGVRVASCQACGYGQFLNSQGKCEYCPDGSYAVDENGAIVESGGVKCEPCPAGTKQRERLSYFAFVKNLEPQVCTALSGAMTRLSNRQSMRGGNLLVVGDPGCGKTVLGTAFVKIMQDEIGKPSGKIGKLTGKALNEKDPEKLLNQVAGGTLIIEKAKDIKKETAEKFAVPLSSPDCNVFVILEGTIEDIKYVMSVSPAFASLFTEKVIVPGLADKELFAFAEAYAEENGFSIGDEGSLALYDRIRLIKHPTKNTTVTAIKEIMDEEEFHDLLVKEEKILLIKPMSHQQ